MGIRQLLDSWLPWKRRNVREADLDRELRDHLDLEAEEQQGAGLSREEAEYAARRALGNTLKIKEDVRVAWGFQWLETVLQDLRYGHRQMRRNPGFTAVAVLSLAIGIGANTALFSIVDELLLKMLPVEAPRELVLFNWLEGRKPMRFGMDGSRNQDATTGQSTSTSFSFGTFRRLQQANQSLTHLFAFYPIQQLNVAADGVAEVSSGQYVSGNYYEGLGVSALVGRTITAEDDQPGAAPVAVITYGYWKRRFGLDPTAIGRAVRINRNPVVIVGVTPSGFRGALQVTQSPDFSLPFATEPLLEGKGSLLQRPAFLWIRIMGRLKPGVAREQAAANLNGAFQQGMLEEWLEALSAQGRTATGDWDRTLADASVLRAEPGGQGLMDVRRSYSQPLLVLLGCVGLVLLAACVNVANLLLARGAARQGEIAMRLSLGASRSRLIRQMLTENFVIAVLGGTVAFPFALWSRSFLLIWRPWGGGPLVLEDTIDWRVFLFCGAVAVCAGIVFGTVPALHAVRLKPFHAAKRVASGGVASPFTRSLVVAQVAMALVLLVAAGLFVRTLHNLHSVALGFNPDHLLLFRVQPQLNGYKPSEISLLYSRIIERLETIPGVHAATLSRHPLLSFSQRRNTIGIEGRLSSSQSDVQVNVVAPNFFRTMEIPLLLGRGLSESDTAAATKVAIVNQAFAEKFLGPAIPIGRHFWFGDKRADTIEIVGITRDAKYTDLRDVPGPTVYIPMEQDVPGQANFEVRTVGDPMALASSVRRAVHDIDPNLPLFEVKSQATQAEESIAQENTFARLSTVFGFLVLLLAAIGLYGTLSYAVTRRTAEFGIRIALGAQRSDVLGMVLRQTSAMGALGVLLGVPAALVGTRVARSVLENVLFGVKSNDPLTLVSAVALLALVALGASYLPARRAMKVDPMTALRCE